MPAEKVLLFKLFINILRIILARKQKPHDVEVRISILKIMAKYHSIEYEFQGRTILIM